MIMRIRQLTALALAAWLAAIAFPVHAGESSSDSDEARALYWQGHEAMQAGDWNAAFERFVELERQRRKNNPASADAAIYWQAYALTQAKRVSAARETIARLQREFPQSRWNDDARALISSAGPGPSLRGLAGDEQAEALIEQSLSAPSEQAAPQLMQIVEGQYSAKIKRRALFVLSQLGDPGSLSRLVAVARGTDAQMRSEAIQMLGVSGATAELREVYAAAPDENSQRDVLRALGVAGAVEPLAEIAGSGTPEMRREAIRNLGVAGATEQLIKLHGQVESPQLRRAVIDALRVGADSKTLLDLYERAKTPEEKQALMRINEELSNDDPE